MTNPTPNQLIAALQACIARHGRAIGDVPIEAIRTVDSLHGGMTFAHTLTVESSVQRVRLNLERVSE